MYVSFWKTKKSSLLIPSKAVLAWILDPWISHLRAVRIIFGVLRQLMVSDSIECFPSLPQVPSCPSLFLGPLGSQEARLASFPRNCSNPSRNGLFCKIFGLRQIKTSVMRRAASAYSLHITTKYILALPFCFCTSWLF
jgi:hypothetical protein